MTVLKNRIAFRVALYYALFAGLWILLSDRLLGILVSDPDLLTRWQTYKGWAFVLASSLVIFYLLDREMRVREGAEQARRRTEKRYAELFDHASDGIFLINQQGCIVDVNQSGANLLGHHGADLLGRPIQDFLISEAAPGLEGLLTEALATGTSHLTEHRLLTKSGTQIPVEISTRVVEAGLYQGIVRDISERKRTEERIRSQVERLGALRKIDMAITSTLDLRVTFSVLLDQVRNLLNVDAACILTIDPRTQGLSYAAGSGFRTFKIREPNLRVGEGIAGQVALERRLISFPNLLECKHLFVRPDFLDQEGFVAYHGVPLVAKGETKGVLEVYNRTPLEIGDDWIEFLEALAGQAAIAIDNMSLWERLQRSSLELSIAYNATLEGWSKALELRDQETQGHSQRVTELTLKLAQEAGMSPEELVHVRRGTLLHDIGKMAIPDQILMKAGPLTPGEWQVMRLHPVYAFEMLAPIEYLRPAIDIPYCHHERWDGSGYPRGLRGEQIPLAARVFAVVDVWDALISDRPYRAAWPEARARLYLHEKSGKHFDPHIVDTFLKMESDKGSKAAP